eukprot:4230348-Pyramimonas_sp.AAC.1
MHEWHQELVNSDFDYIEANTLTEQLEQLQILYVVRTPLVRTNAVLVSYEHESSMFHARTVEPLRTQPARRAALLPKVRRPHYGH